MLLLCHVAFLPTDINKSLPGSLNETNFFEDPRTCWGQVERRTSIARFLTWIFVALLLLLEVFQFITNVLTGNWREYLSKQNFCELLMLGLTIAFLVIEWQVHQAPVGDQIENALKNSKGRASNQESLLGKAF